MLDAILFDWGDTLMRWAPDPDLLELGHAAGLRAVGRDPVPGMTERFRDGYLSFFWAPGTLEELEYPFHDWTAVVTRWPRRPPRAGCSIRDLGAILNSDLAPSSPNGGVWVRLP